MHLPFNFVTTMRKFLRHQPIFSCGSRSIATRLTLLCSRHRCELVASTAISEELPLNLRVSSHRRARLPPSLPCLYHRSFNCRSTTDFPRFVSLSCQTNTQFLPFRMPFSFYSRFPPAGRHRSLEPFLLIFRRNAQHRFRFVLCLLIIRVHFYAYLNV